MTKSPLERTPEEKAEYISTIRQAVESFVKESGIGSKFSDLVEFMNKQFRTADEEMFKEWTQKEFPGQFTYTHTLPATYDGEDEEEFE